MENFYGLGHNVQSFAIANELVVSLNKACYKLGQNLQPFCIYGNEKQKQFNLVDFAQFSGLAGKGSLIDEIVEYRKGVFNDIGIHVNTADELQRKLLFFDYLLSISVCYVEVPKYKTKDGFAQESFDKFLCTRNPALMAAWMGDTTASMQAKYSRRIITNQLDFNENCVRYVKLNTSSKGNSITVPRGYPSVSDMTCIPLFMINAFTKGFRPMLDDSILEFTFLKDNGTYRVLPTTLNYDILMDYYKDNMFVGTMLAGVDIESVQQGGLTMSSKIHRGYCKVPELGSSIYDGTGVRSLNLARLLSIKKVTEVDRSYIHVDLNSVVANFKECLEYIIQHNSSVLPNIYRDIIGKVPETFDIATMVGEIYKDVDAKAVFLSTSYFRSLHSYMANNPMIFPLYTGKPKGTLVSGSQNFGVAQMDF